MNLLVAVINDEHLLDECLMGWVDIGVMGATVIESMGALQLISENIPIFAGFRTLVSGGAGHNKTVFAVIEEKEILDNALAFLKSLFQETGKSHQGVYFIIPLSEFGHLGKEISHEKRIRDMQKMLS